MPATRIPDQRVKRHPGNQPKRQRAVLALRLVTRYSPHVMRTVQKHARNGRIVQR
jgi:hypothetical protein